MSIQKKSYSLFIFLDMLCMTIAFFAGIYVRHGSFAVLSLEIYREVYVVLLFSIIGITFFFRPYEDIFIRGFWIEFVNVSKCVAVQMVIAVGYLFMVQAAQKYSRLAFGYALLFDLIVTYVGRIISKRILVSVFAKNVNRKKLLIVTTCDRAPSILEAMNAEKQWEYEVTGLAIMDRECVGETLGGVAVTASAASLYDDVRMAVLDSVFIGLDPHFPRFQDTINLFHVMGVTVHVDLQNYDLELPNQQIQKMGNLTVLTGNTPQDTLGDVAAKRALDIFGSLIGLLITAVLTLFVGPAIAIESRGPIFFSQIRIGKNGRRFKLYKFRSMYTDAEERKKELMEQNKMQGLMFKMDNDPRITRVGAFIRKTSIDEFPQFWNVLKGDMSLVGTRPPTEDEFTHYKARYKKRLSMKPGITGLWQVSGRSDITDFEEVVKLDVEYIENWSFGRDLRILAQTVLVIFRHEGAQ